MSASEKKIQVDPLQVLQELATRGPTQIARIRSMLDCDAHSPEGRELSCQLGAAVDWLETRGLVDWDSNPMSGDKLWSVTEAGREALEVPPPSDHE